MTLEKTLRAFDTACAKEREEEMKRGGGELLVKEFAFDLARRVLEETIRGAENDALERAAVLAEQKTGFEDLPRLSGIADSIRTLKHPTSTDTDPRYALADHSELIRLGRLQISYRLRWL